ncbi:Phage minor structural protein GP20 [Oceanobacillus limi]|uniref:Phage minor structural protein GP20 n=1 Tax=Oceanobacillus limi TaxID=930131 RepID=A0A1I0GDX4_9BACI|nr:phage scaffolding protein [Oceanobacillus limi]SET69058.1 Phage minor structural protein GP20 [Oceanobacillus limi]
MSEEVKNEEVNEETTKVDETKETSETTEKTNEKSDDTFVPQSKVNDIVQKRVAREKEKYADYDDLKAKLTEYEKAEQERKEAEMTELERLQSQLEQYQKTAEEAEQIKQQTLESANQRLIKSEFKVLAKDSGIRKDALEAAFKLADFESVEVDEDGNVKGVDSVIESLKESSKFLFGGNDYADPSPGQHEAKRDPSKDQIRKKLEELETKARKSGRIEDKVAYASYKREVGL